MHSLYYQAVDSMDLEQVNHFEREGVLPIAFSLFHYTNMHDASFFALTGVSPIWDPAWQAKVQMAVDDHGKERTVDEMTSQRIGDYDAFKSYQRAVFERTEAHLGDDRSRRRAPRRDPAPIPRRHRLDVQREVRGAGGSDGARRLRVLAVPARPAAHGRDRARPRTGGPRRDDLLDLTQCCVVVLEQRRRGSSRR